MYLIESIGHVVFETILETGLSVTEPLIESTRGMNSLGGANVSNPTVDGSLIWVGNTYIVGPVSIEAWVRIFSFFYRKRVFTKKKNGLKINTVETQRITLPIKIHSCIDPVLRVYKSVYNKTYKDIPSKHLLKL